MELKTIRFTPAARIASSRAMPPATFSRKYLAGSAIDSPTSDLAAQWRTASMPASLAAAPSTVAASP